MCINFIFIFCHFYVNFQKNLEDLMIGYRLEKRKADALANGVFLICLGILFFTGYWWPGILLALYVTLAIRQFLTGRIFDLIITSFILLGLFIISVLKLRWELIMPLLFIFGGAYIIFREYFYSEEPTEPKNLDNSFKDSDNGKKDF